MTTDKVRPFLTRPLVIDWLQWGEFPEKLGEPDMPQVALRLLAEYKAKVEQLENEVRTLRVTIQTLKERK